MFEILKNFETKYGHLKKKGLTIEGLAMVDVKKKKHVIKISRPLIFVALLTGLKNNTFGHLNVLKNMLSVAKKK